MEKKTKGSREEVLYITYRSGALLDWKGDSVTNYYYSLRLRYREPMPQRTQWHVTRLYNGKSRDRIHHVMESSREGVLVGESDSITIDSSKQDST